MSKKSRAYPLWLRLWHWSNAVLFVALLITGISMHYSKAGPGPMGFRADVLTHNVSGMLLILFYCLFRCGNLWLGNGRYYRIGSGEIEPGLFRQTRYYLWGIFMRSPHPYPESEERKFNPLQKMFYLVVMYLLFPLLMVTGAALLFPDRLPAEMLGVPGIGLWAIVHTYAGFFLSLFMVIHIYLGTTGATSGALFRLMWAGHDSCAQSKHAQPENKNPGAVPKPPDENAAAVGDSYYVKGA